MRISRMVSFMWVVCYALIHFKRFIVKLLIHILRTVTLCFQTNFKTFCQQTSFRNARQQNACTHNHVQCILEPYVRILNVSNAYNAKLGIYTANSYQQLQKLTPRNVKYTIYQWQTLIWVHVENLTCRTGTCWRHSCTYASNWRAC